jgi:hypothetical protein
MRHGVGRGVPAPFRGSRRRTALSLLSLIVALAAATPGPAQTQPVAGQNINMVSGTTWPGGDPFLQRQNEPSLAVSSRNALHLLAGANDYRTVDLPTEPGSIPGTLSGDAWLGLFKSFDGGKTWQSVLLPGYPQDTSAAGMASPLKAYAAAADPTVRAAANGLLYYSGIAFNRGTNIGAVFLSRHFDQNSKENGDATLARDTIAYIDTRLIDTGTSGQFLDKPWIAVDVPRTGSGATTCSFTPPGGSPQSFVGGNLYMTWSRFTGSQSTKIMFSRSLDCGKTWSNPTKISESNSINQGTNIAVDPKNGTVYVAWRRFASSSQPDAIMVAKSSDYGKTFASKDTVQVAAISPLDQGTSGTEFRTNALPTIAASVDAGNTSRVHVAWAQRNTPNQDAQIVLSTSTDGAIWSSPVAVDAAPITDDTTPIPNTFSRGHQFMPQLTFSQGRLIVLYYDQRLDHTLGFYVYDPGANPAPEGMFQGSYSYKLFRHYQGELPAHPEQVFTLGIDDAFLSERRHTVDLRVASAVPGASLSFATTTVSQYRFGLRALDVTDVPEGLDQLEDNPPNLPLFAQGTVPFLGDYVDIAGQNIVSNGSGGWKFNTAASTAPVFYATWTDNRDVVPPQDGNWAHYTPAGPVHQSVLDPTQQTQPCVNGQEGMRNQNVYSSRITEGLAVSSPQNVKPLSATLQRAFIVTLQNFTNQQRTFHVTILDPQPAGGWASFTAGVNVPLTAPSPITKTIDVTVEANSSAARPVFATSSVAASTITVNVVEAGGAGLTGTVVLNPEGSVSPLTQPDGTNVNIGGLEVYTPTFEVWDPNNANPFLNIGNPDISILNIGNLNIGNLNIGNAAPILNIGNDSVGNLNIGNLNIGNTDPANLNIGNLNIGNATEANLNIGNLNIGNLNIGNLNIGNTAVSDASYAVDNTGNTTHSYRVALYGNNPNSTPLQLIVTKNATTPTSVNCTLQSLPQGEVVATVNNAQMASSIQDATDPKIQDSSVSNATVSLAPGERIFITVRAALTNDQMKDFVKQMTPVVTAHGTNTNGLANDFAALLFIQTQSGALPAAIVGVPYNGTGFQFVSVGGSGTITWTSGNGALPTGLTLSPSGLLSGTPSAGGTFTFDVTAHDSGPTQQTSTQTISMTVSKRATSTAIAFTPSSVVVGQTATVTVTVTDTQGSGTASSPTGTVALTGTGLSAPSCTLVAGAQGTSTCSVTVTPTAAVADAISAAYSGSDQHLAGMLVQTGLTVNPASTTVTASSLPNPSAFGQPVTFTATVTPVAPGAGVRTGTVTFFDGAAALGSGNVNAAGAATFVTAATALAAGAHTIKATYSGDANFIGNSSAPYTQTVNAAGTTTTVVSGLNPSAFGQSVTFTATVTSGAGTPSGNVNFLDGATVLATKALSSGTASFSTSTLSAGAHSITAAYLGVANYAVSTSTVLTQTVTASLYTFTGFLSPMATAGTQQAPSNSGSARYGSAIPVKWQLKDSAGNWISDLTTATALTAVGYQNGGCSGMATGTSFLLYSPTTGAKGGSTFRYDSGTHQFIFNFATGYVSPAGCYELELQLNDGSPIKATIENLN